MEPSGVSSRLRRRPSIHKQFSDDKMNGTDDQTNNKQTYDLRRRRGKDYSEIENEGIEQNDSEDSSYSDEVDNLSHNTENKSDEDDEILDDHENSKNGEGADLLKIKKRVFQKEQLFSKEPSKYIPECVPFSPARNRQHSSFIVAESTQPSNYSKKVICFFLFIVVIVFCWANDLGPKSLEPCQSEINLIKDQFPSQDDSFWTYFESGVKDVKLMNRPSTFIFLHKEQAEETLNQLLPELTKYASCYIKNRFQKPIEIDDAELNSPDVIRNYGVIIEKYTPQLEKKGVLVVRNLHSVPGISAQVFHSICDEFTPLVQESLIIFTMKIDDDFSPSLEAVEDFFKKKWTDLKVDTLNALITRITSMVVEVKN